MSANTILGDGVVSMPSETTANRPATPAAGMIRFNTTTNLMEYYDGTIWKAIDAPPTISSVSPTTYNGESGTTITINGTNFQTGCTVVFITSTGSEYNSSTTTVVNSNQVTAVTPQDFTVAQGPLDIKLTNSSGLSATSVDCLATGNSPSWSTTSGSLGTIYDSALSGKTFTISANDPDAGATISYSIASGSLPTGMSLNSATGVISGTASAVVSDTTYSFTARVTDNAGNTADRAFSITVKAPTVQSFTSGSSNWTVPTGLTAVQVLVVAGGGAGGAATGFEAGGGGGAGGLVYHATYPVSPGGSIPYSIGSGGTSTNNQPNGSQADPAHQGGNSVFGAITANGGGYGGGQYWPATAGGSGGGQAGNGYGASGSATQTPSGGGTGYGYAGGTTSGGANGGATGAGGGGAGAAGAGAYSAAAPGGVGLAYSISGSSVYYAGGGGGAGSQNGASGGGSGGNGGGGPGGPTGTPGTTNRGGGGGGACGGQGNTSGAGGPGIIIVKY